MSAHSVGALLSSAESVSTAVTATTRANQQPFGIWLFRFLRQFLTSKHFVVVKLVISPGTRNLYSLPPLQEFWPGVFPKPRESFALWEKVGPGQARLMDCALFLPSGESSKRQPPSPFRSPEDSLIAGQLAAGIYVCSQAWVQLPPSGLLPISVSPGAPFRVSKGPWES